MDICQIERTNAQSTLTREAVMYHDFVMVQLNKKTDGCFLSSLPSSPRELEKGEERKSSKKAALNPLSLSFEPQPSQGYLEGGEIRVFN